MRDVNRGFPSFAFSELRRLIYWAKILRTVFDTGLKEDALETRQDSLKPSHDI